MHHLTPCGFEGCTAGLRSHNKSGLCKQHWNVVINGPRRRVSGPRTPCGFEGCPKMLRSDNKSGLCQKHWHAMHGARREREWRAANPELAANRRKQWDLDHPGARRDADLRKKYGITSERWESYLDDIGHSCEHCGREVELHVDHDHVTGSIRGALCFDCNTSIGKLGDNAESLMRVVEYLRRSCTI